MLSPAGLTRLSLSPVRLNSGTWHRRACPAAGGDADAREAAWSYITLLFPVIKTSTSHSSLIFFFFLFSILPTDGLSLDIGRGGGGRRTSGLLSDGAPGLRELRAHGGPGVNDASGWTLLPGKDGAQSFFVFLCWYVLFPCSPVPDTALGECPWHNRKCPDPVMSLC